jgi:hypothetical protein
MSKKIVAVFTENQVKHVNTHWTKLNVKVVNICELLFIDCIVGQAVVMNLVSPISSKVYLGISYCKQICSH